MSFSSSASHIPHPDDTIPTSLGSFESLGLSKTLLASVRAFGFEKPTPIQQAVIPIALTDRDVIGLAQTGSGKTAAFVIPLAERLTHGKGTRGIILCPTREIALQTKAFIDALGVHHNLRAVCLIGGVKIGPQFDDLKEIPDIIVATPGRLLDHIERGTVFVDHISELVLDEADHMLDLGFMPQIRAILSRLPKKRHSMMFSATMPPPIEDLTRQFLHDPVRVDVLPEGRIATGITHRLYLVDEPDAKRDALIALLKQEEGRIIVFVREKIYVDSIARENERYGHTIERLHSDRSQSERVRALERFRDGTCRILIATDIAARGIDIPAIEHVINFDMPDSVEDYIHRAGRTARANAIGCVSSIGTWIDKTLVNALEKTLNQKLPRLTLPGVKPYVELKLDPAASRRRRR